ncbi:MAG TPA: hypothetical protein VKA44_00865, partial [Gemmatimonadota bacterium]|nr:hypothetical protein [Gemmatimonadota bacterium]
MTTPDLLYLAFITAALLLDHVALWPSFLRRAEADAGRARAWVWSAWMTMLWTLVAAGAALWLVTGRPWEALRLSVPHGWRLWSGVVLLAAVALVY